MKFQICLQFCFLGKRKDMKQKIKYILIVLLIVQLVTVWTFAEEDDIKECHSSFCGAREATVEQMAYWAEKAQTIHREPRRTLEEAKAAAAAINGTRGWIYVIGPNYYYPQETSYSCGPACIRMMLKRITGVNYSEQTIRTACYCSSWYGTFLSDMISYANSVLAAYSEEEYFYLAGYQASKTTMRNQLYAGIVQNDMPPIIAINESVSSVWPYPAMLSHYVLVDAVTENADSFRIWEPWAGYIQDSGWENKTNFIVSCDDLYDAYSGTNAGYMY